MSTVLDLSHVKAREYFLSPQNYCQIELPKYIDFQSILTYVEKKIGNRELKDILADPNTYPSEYDGVNYKLYINKDAKYAYRLLQIANPFLYYMLINYITKKNNWNFIRERFEQFKNEKIEVSSIPVVVNKKKKKQVGESILEWWKGFEQRSIELSMSYRYMFITDISNCYPSIYTHSISWALMGKDNAKAHRQKENLSNVIDRYIMGMQYGQTNGIPQGSVLFDFISEIVIGYADSLLTEKLKELNILDYHILRYRDDYRIYSNSKDELETISFTLQSILADLNFQMNSAKTRLSDNIIEDSIKQDKYYYYRNVPGITETKRTIKSCFQNPLQELYYIHDFSSRYPNSGMVFKLLKFFRTKIEKDKKLKKESINVLIALLVDITLKSPKAFRLTICIISYLLRLLDNENEKEKLLEIIVNKLNNLHNSGHIQTWMQRMTYKYDRDNGLNRYDEKICRLVQGENIELWNLAWLKPEYIDGFPWASICDNKKLETIIPEIKLEEVDVFGYNEM